MAPMPEPPRDQLDRALRIAEIVRSRGPVPRGGLRGTGAGERQPPPFENRFGFIAAGRVESVALPDLEDRDVVGSVPDVRGHGLNEAADQRRPEHGVIDRQRVADRDDPTAFRADAIDERHPRFPAERLGDLRRDKGVGHDFGQARPGQHLSDRVTDLERRVPVRGHRRVREDARDFFVPVDSGDLLGKVGFDLDIPPPGRDGRDERLVFAGRDLERLRAGRDGDGCARRRGLGLDPDAGKEVALLVWRQLGAEEAIDA